MEETDLMKNLLFWLYAIVAVILIAFGYTYWENKVTDSDNQEKATTQTTKEQSTSDSKQSNKKVIVDKKSKAPNKNLFNNKEFQSIYNKKTKDGKKMNITLVSTPYQVSEDNQSVKDALTDISDSHLKYKEVEVSGTASSLDMEDIYKTNTDLVILDALTLNDFSEQVSSNDHITTLESIYNTLEQNNIPVIIVGTRPEYNDSTFADYQSNESSYFQDSNSKFNYIDQSSKWPDNKAIADYYNVEDGLLTDRGVDRWTNTIADYLFTSDSAE